MLTLLLVCDSFSPDHCLHLFCEILLCVTFLSGGLWTLLCTRHGYKINTPLERSGPELSMLLLLEQTRHIWRHEERPHKACRFCTTLAISMQHAWINKLNSYNFPFARCVMIISNILLDTTRFWVYQILFHYDYSWFYECNQYMMIFRDCWLVWNLHIFDRCCYCVNMF